MNTVLLAAFHFPPYKASSGLQRPLSLARNLPAHHWSPVVLTAGGMAYAPADRTGEAMVPAGVPIGRAPALDTARHLSLFGRYWSRLALPDRWITWLVAAVPRGLALIRRHRAGVIWTTYPLATTHLLGMTLHRLTGLPWVADFRDPMVECIDGVDFPEDPALRAARLRVERQVSQHASAATFCTHSARQIFLQRHDWGTARPAEVIANGFDEEAFETATALPQNSADGMLLVHSGTLYPGPDRDPGAFFTALAKLRDAGKLPPRLCVRLRATGFDSVYAPVITKLGLEHIVELAPALDYSSALREMLDADGLLLFQGSTSNPAIPAKVYEYLRAGPPILAMVDARGETASLLTRMNAGVQAPLDDAQAIASAAEDYLSRLPAGTVPVPEGAEVGRLSRAARAAEFADLFDRLVSSAASDP